MPDAPPPRPVELCADRDARREDVRDVLGRVLAAPGVGDRVRWDVVCASQEHPVHQAARRVGPAPEGGGRLVVRIVSRPVRDEVPTQLDVELAVSTWSIVTRETDWESPSREATRAAWRAAARAIRGAVGDRQRLALVAHGEGGTHVAWSHVATVLDVLLGLGIRDVTLPAVDVELRLEAPDDLTLPPAGVADDPVLTPIVAFLATFMALVGLAVTWLPAWLERSARKRPRGRRPP